ncbi:respiratory selenite reductase-associated lipoprotein SrrF [Salisediminibacterium beveridgei]|uniref:Rhodanese Domain-Containing Protein n=1 Tax=Salisediminibacterium beveridgei TaxID=632773 RepID=A0A1D7QTQ0_9BACI|nr:respiratory selenite reductase-associated lipoprotein SrrF [Salisediminibacterium beveridgei]AOM82391.1 Rhodanese Domain-Containing Protein [Salisediminibacterium beveridgei]
MKKWTISFISLAGVLALSACGSSQASESEPTSFLPMEPDTSPYIIETEEEDDGPEDVPYNEDWDYIDTAQLSRLMDGLPEISQDRSTYDEVPPEWDKVALIDSRPPEVYAAGHINGAINIPDSNFDNYSDLLPEDLDTKLIFYCGGLHCPLSGSSSEKAEEMGYENTYVYQEGTPFWKEEGNYFTVTPEYVEEQILESNVVRDDTEPVMIIDTRTYAGYFGEHIPTAVFWDDTQYGSKYQGFAPANKDAEIIIYCGGFFCHKSPQLANELLADGYTNVKVLSGGMPAWKQAGLPTFGMDTADSEFDVSAGKVDRSVSADEFDEFVDSGATIVDVRGDSEVAGGMIDGALHIPDGDIHANDPSVEEKLPDDLSTTLVIHCASGARAAGVVENIADFGYEEVYYWDGGISISEDGSYTLD